MPECSLEPDGVLGPAPPVSDKQAGVVIDEREQVTLGACDLGSVERIAGPTIVPGGGLEPAERRRWCPIRAGVQPQPGEMALNRAPRRNIAVLGGAHDRNNLCCGPFRLLALQLHRQVQHRGRCSCCDLTARRDQRVEPARAPQADPTIQRRARHPHVGAVRANMWAAPRFPDSDLRQPLRCHVLVAIAVVRFNRCLVTDTRMKPGTIIPNLDPMRNTRHGLSSCRKHCPMNELVLQ